MKLFKLQALIVSIKISYVQTNILISSEWYIEMEWLKASDMCKVLEKQEKKMKNKWFLEAVQTTPNEIF
jgi:hypothetical protein